MQRITISRYLGKKTYTFCEFTTFFCWALHRERQSISCFVTQVIIFIQIYYSIKMSSGFKIHHLDWLEETKQLYNFLLVLFRLKISSLFSVKLSLVFSSLFTFRWCTFDYFHSTLSFISLFLCLHLSNLYYIDIDFPSSSIFLHSHNIKICFCFILF